MLYVLVLGFSIGAAIGAASIYVHFPPVTIAQAIAVDIILVCAIGWVHSYRKETPFLLRLGAYLVALVLGVIYLFLPLR